MNFMRVSMTPSGSMHTPGAQIAITCTDCDESADHSTAYIKQTQIRRHTMANGEHIHWRDWIGPVIYSGRSQRPQAFQRPAEITAAC